jgi:hypothetical protein
VPSPVDEGSVASVVGVVVVVVVLLTVPPIRAPEVT